VADEVPDDWSALPDDDAIVAVGWQGMLRTLVAGAAVTRRAPADRVLLRRADLVGVSHHDVEPTTSLDALASHLHAGARLLVTQGHHGGLLVTVGADRPAPTLRYLPTRTERETDATGAGDTFLGALVAATIRPSIMGLMRRRLGADLRFAAAAGSLAVEGVGLAGVPDLMAVRGRAVRERVRRLVVPSELAQVTVETSFEP
jgi:sugar/nucleoside kinase (ribokinase family)